MQVRNVPTPSKDSKTINTANLSADIKQGPKVVKQNPQAQEDSIDKVTLMEPGLFRVNIPEQFNFPPEKILQEIMDPTSAQTATAPYYRYQSNDNISTYEIGYIRLPDQNFRLKSLQTILDDLTRGEIARLQGSLKKEITINESNTFSRREVEIESNVDNLYAREFLIINRPYAYIICFTSKNPAKLNAKKAESFFSSFELFEQNGPRTIIVESVT
ncbi:MAG: hypothetical protein QNJ31_08665 [Candidatus Caenarcaniphilales bacterium]|nr:hypothetical protein [Candidatus Caenarcaniphilales bacterium]